ncbi:hypothetical protein pb186bvf_017764 [Paramecium bursaria]
MKQYMTRLYSIPDQDKENYPYYVQPRHGRVLSQLGCRDKSSSSLHEVRFLNQKPIFKAQKFLNGDDDPNVPTLRNKEIQRVKTDCNVSVALRHGRNLSTTGISTSPINFKKNNEFPYKQEITTFMKETCRSQLKMNAFQFQNEINEKMRSILLDWIVDVHNKLKLDNQTLFLTIGIIDRVLELQQISKSQFQLYGVTALFIASKYEEVYCVPHVRDLVYVCDNAYTKEQILNTEGIIIQILNFDISHTTSYRMLNLYQETVKLDFKNFMLARYMIELSALEYSTNQFNSNVVASAAIYLVHKIRKVHPSWSQDIINMTGLLESDIRGCAKELCTLLQNQDKKQFTSIKKKYSQTKYSEVAKIRIEKKGQ